MKCVLEETKAGVREVFVTKERKQRINFHSFRREASRTKAWSFHHGTHMMGRDMINLQKKGC